MQKAASNRIALNLLAIVMAIAICLCFTGCEKKGGDGAYVGSWNVIEAQSDVEGASIDADRMAMYDKMGQPIVVTLNEDGSMSIDWSDGNPDYSTWSGKKTTNGTCKVLGEKCSMSIGEDGNLTLAAEGVTLICTKQ